LYYVNIHFSNPFSLPHSSILSFYHGHLFVFAEGCEISYKGPAIDLYT
jgi:hypothetical protein